MEGYKRDPKKVIDQLVERNGQLSTKVDCRIQVPARYTDVGLGSLGVRTFIYGAYALILNDSNTYCVSNVCSMVEINPDRNTAITINGVLYHEFHFKAGQVVLPSLEVVKKDILMFNVIDEFIFKGKVPWFFEYNDLGKLFDTAKDYANSRIGQSLGAIEVLASLITRPKSKRDIYVRTIAKDYSDVDLSAIDYIPLNSVFYAVNSTLNKLAGSYFSDGINSSLVTPTTEVSTIEHILRA